MATLEKLLDAMGLTSKLRDATDNVIAAMKKNFDDQGVTIPPERWATFDAELHAHDIAKMIEDAARASMTFTPDEMDAVIEFYQSPRGARIMEKMTLVNQIVDKASSSWIETKGRAVMAKVLK